MGGARLIERVELEHGSPPKDITGAGVDGDWVKMVGGRLLISLLSGAWAGGTSAITLEQATSNAGAGAKALAFDKQWVKTGQGAASPWVETAVVANTFNVAAANKIHAIEVDAADLDVNGGFLYVRCRAATPGANADLLAIHYLHADLRYAGVPADHIDSKV